MKTANLPGFEWRFHKVAPEQLPACWRWEIEREARRAAGSEPGLPWVRLSKADKDKCVAYCGSYPEMACTAIDIETAPPDSELLRREWLAYNETDPKTSKPLPLELALFRIDWSKSRTSIKREFEAWIDSNPTFKSSQWPGEGSPGRKEQYKAWLTDLAIYRCDQARFSPTKGAVRLEALRAWCGLSGETPGTHNKFSGTHWESACKKSRNKIAKVSGFTLKDVLENPHLIRTRI